MDIRTEWPWSLEEEAEWKAELTEHELASVDALPEETVEETQETGPEGDDKISADGSFLEKYLITA
jgi:hypothetical protein